ncbi:MAG: enoyl-CoA hydratase/isomerase family protein [Alphaproteobacteria bacterium]
MDYETIRIEGDGPVRHLVLNRPHVHNAVNKHFVADMNAACWQLDKIEGLRAVILRGEGKSFCSGADLKDRPFEEGATATVSRSKDSTHMCDALANLSAVTIACMHNYCIGGGAVLPTFCDFRIAAKSTSLTINEISIGVNLGWNSIPPIVQLVGPARAKEMIILGRTYSAEKLLDMGYVNDVVEDDDLIAAGERLAAHICRQPPMPVWATKASINAYSRALDRSVQHLDHLAMAFMSKSPNTKIARKTYFDKSAPDYVDE